VRKVSAYCRQVRQALPGDLLVRPVPIVAGVVLALNDHVLKAQIGDTITGKLSDAAGLVFVPLLLLALLELGRAACRVAWPITYRDVVTVVILVGGALVAAKLSVPAAHAFGDVGGVLRYPFRGRLNAVTITHDPSDLLTIPALAVALAEGATVIRSRKVIPGRLSRVPSPGSAGPT
jgi:hypothetical protein